MNVHTVNIHVILDTVCVYIKLNDNPREKTEPLRRMKLKKCINTMIGIGMPFCKIPSTLLFGR